MVIVVGVDESPQAVVVVRRAMEEAERRGAELHMVHVFHPPVAYLEVPIDIGALAEAHRGAVWEALEPITSGSSARRVDLEGYPPDSLVSYATEVGAELMVVGTRGRGELAALFLGSTSHRVVHLAKCDVLVVKPTAG